MTPEEFKRGREIMGLTQAELAREFGKDMGTISRYERGVIPIPKMAELAIGFLITRPLTEIMWGDEND